MARKKKQKSAAKKARSAASAGGNSTPKDAAGKPVVDTGEVTALIDSAAAKAAADPKTGQLDRTRKVVKVKIPKGAGDTGGLRRNTGSMRAITGGFNALDDFFFGSETGAFERDEFDYDPFEDPAKSGATAVAPGKLDETKQSLEPAKGADTAAPEAAEAAPEAAKKSRKKTTKSKKSARQTSDQQLFLPAEEMGGSDHPTTDIAGPTVAVMESIPLSDRRAAGAAEAAKMTQSEQVIEGPESTGEIDLVADEVAVVPEPLAVPTPEVIEVVAAAAPFEAVPRPMADDDSAATLAAMPAVILPAEAPEETDSWPRFVASLAAEVEALPGKKNARRRAAYLFEIGRILLGKLGDPAGAEARWNAACQAVPEFAPALRALVGVCAARKDWARAIDIYSRAVEEDTNPSAQVTALLGIAHAQLAELDRLSEAEASLRHALQVEPDNYVALRLLREIPYRLEDWSGLAGVLDEIARCVTGDELFRCFHEQALLFEDELSDPERALGAYRNCLEADPHCISVFLAVEGLLQRSDATADLVDLYQRAAAAWTGAESSFWHARAARTAANGGLPVGVVVQEFQAAIGQAQNGAPLAEEFRHWLEAGGHWDALAEACNSSLQEGAPPRLVAHLESTLGRIALQHQGDARAAAEHFSNALTADPDCFEAREGLRQGLIAAADWRGLLDHDESRIDALGDSRVALAVRLGMAHVAAHQLQDFETAEQHLRTAIERSPNYLPALDALVEVYGAQGKSREQAEALESAAGILNSGPSRASYMLRAARLWADLGDRERSIRLLQQSSGDGPGPLLAREWLVESYIAEERWADAAESLRQIAAETDDPTLKVSLLYRSAQLALWRCNDEAGAEAAFRNLLDLAPDFLPAARGLRAIYSSRGDWDALGLLVQQEAEGRSAGGVRQWLHLSAGAAYERAGRMGDALGQYKACLEAEPGDEIANSAIRRVYRTTADHAALVDSFTTQLTDSPEPGSHTAALRLQLISTLADMGDAASVASEVAQLLAPGSVRGLPLAALGMVCDRLQCAPEALSAFAALAADKGADPAARAAALYHQGLLVEESQDDPVLATSLYERADKLSSHHALSLEALQRLYVEGDEISRLASVYERLSQSADTAPVRTFYALLAGENFENVGDRGAASSSYRVACADPVGLHRAYGRMGDLLVEDGSLDALSDLTARLVDGCGRDDAISRWMELGDRLAGMDEHDASVEAFGKALALDAAFVPAALHTVHACWNHADWNGALAALQSVSSHAVSDVARKEAETLSEELLADKGVTSDGAFEFYERLYQREPENAVALRGLGGIHFARKELGKAREFYEALSEHADDDHQKAEASTQVGLIAIESEDEADTGVIHFEQALEFDGTHRPAIAALKSLHTDSGNWNSLVGVLAREASLAEPDRRLPMFAEIARIWQEEIGNNKVAALSWKKVLGLDPANAGACSGLLQIHEADGDWKAYLDVADQSLAGFSGNTLRDRQAELGLVARDKASQPERAMAYLSAAAAGDQPSPLALDGLRAMARESGDWEELISHTRTLAQVSDDPEEKVALLLEAAELREDPLLDREGAAELFAAVVDLDPNNPAAQRFFVNYWFEKDRWGDALTAFQRYEPVIEGLDVEGNEDARFEATDFYSRYGVVMSHALDDGDGRAQFSRALELTPAHLPSLQAIAPLYHGSGMWQETRSTCQAMLRLGSGDAEQVALWNLWLGRAELALDDSKNALKRFKKALSGNANNIDALEGIAEVHWRANDWNSLLTTYNSIIKYARDPEQVVRAYMTKGDVLEGKLNFTDKAVLHFEKVLMYDQENVPAMARLGQIALSRGDVDRGKKYAVQACEAASENDERAQGLLLDRLAHADDNIEVEGLIRYVTEASGAGELLDEFAGLLDGRSSVPRAEAIDAYGRAFRRF
jgi:tetratricopeptide (TPR) repeat protein